MNRIRLKCIMNNRILNSGEMIKMDKCFRKIVILRISNGVSGCIVKLEER